MPGSLASLLSLCPLCLLEDVLFRDVTGFTLTKVTQGRLKLANIVSNIKGNFKGPGETNVPPVKELASCVSC